MDLAALLRAPALVAGPAAVLAFGSFVVAMIVAGEDALDTHPLATASSALLLVTLLGILAAGIGVLARLREAGRGVGGPALALVGTVLVAGGVWATLFVMPAVAAAAPEALETELVGVVVGFIASYLVFTVGWVWTGIALIRSRLLPTGLGVFVTVAGVVAFVPSPEPARLLLIGIAASLVASRLAAPAAVPARDSVPATA